jgi:general secretion pathway protein G
MLRGRSGPLRRQGGFTLLELIVVVCVAAVMMGVLFNRLQVYKEAAEKAAMQQTAAAIKSALQMRVASYMISGQDNEIDKLAAKNPINWLQENPGNYAGEFFADAYARVPPGSWYYDLTRQELVYVVNLGDNFKPAPDGRKWVRYRVRIAYEDLPLRDGGVRKILSAVSFAPVQPFVWF